MVLVLLSLLLFLGTVAGGSVVDKPNILFVLIDDMGYGDMGYTYPDIPKNITTPLFDKLASEGLILDRYYSQFLCTPARGSLYTGRYAIALGITDDVFHPWRKECLDRDQILLPEVLRANGYATHMVGKWHLGYARWDCMPCTRGFDTAYGYTQGQLDYMSHLYVPGEQYNDFFFCEEDGDEINWSILPNSTQTYSENLYTSRTKDLVESHNTSQPLFMMYSMQNVHYPFFAPDAYFQEDCTDKENPSCVRQAMLNAAQDSLSEVIESYKEAGIWNNTLLIVASDNGAEISRFASSLPLRGWKETLFEGGVRVPAFLYSPNPDILVPRGSTSCYIHVTDWFSTLIRWTGGWDALANISKVRKSQIYTLDSIDQSDFLFTGKETHCLRNEILVHINPVNEVAGYIKGDYKALFGVQSISSESTCQTNYQYTFGEHCVNWNVTRLFNITDDPFETNNLSKTHPDVLEVLKAKIMDYFDELEPLQCTLPAIEGSFPTEVMHYFLPFDFAGGIIPDWATYAHDPPSFH
eukprot:sb/3463834/